MKEKLLEVIKNGKNFIAKEEINDDLGYRVMGEGPWFTNSQFGGHIFLDNDISKEKILGEIDGERIIYNEENLSDYFGKGYILDFLKYKDEDWYISNLNEELNNKKELENWFYKNNVDGFIFIDCKNYLDEGDVYIGFIFYKNENDIYCITYANVEELIRWNEKYNDNFNNALALKR